MKTKYLKAFIFLLLIITLRPIVSEESSIYCFVGDAGEVNPTQAMVVNALANSDCSLVWHLGDITQLGVQSMDDLELQDSFLNPFKPLIETEIPFYLTVGNHDYKGDPNVYLEVAKNYSSIIYPNNFYTKRFGELCFFVLDTTIFDKLYYFHKRGSQIRWLKDKVKEYKSGKTHRDIFS